MICPFFLDFCYVNYGITTDEEEYTNSMYSIPTLLAFEVSLSSGFGMTDFFLRLSKGKLSKN